MIFVTMMVAALWIQPSQTYAVDSAETSAVFFREFTNSADVVRAEWSTSALGIYEAYVNGVAVGGFLKPGFTEADRCRQVFSYDVTRSLKREKGSVNRLTAIVTEGWARDFIVLNRLKDAAFYGSLRLEYSDGGTELVETDMDWSGKIGGPVPKASVFDGEVCDLRQDGHALVDGLAKVIESREFKGELRPARGNRVRLRWDLELKPVRAYVWNGVTASETNHSYGCVKVCREYAPDVEIVLEPGETLVVDFGQNCAAEPLVDFSGERGARLEILPAEMLNDGNGLMNRGNDGPGGSVYRANLRGIRAHATVFASGGRDSYMPRFTFFGFRYLSLTTDDRLRIRRLRAVPVSSVGQEDERGFVRTGNAAVNRLIENARWGMRSNYLSVPMDCPQRNERMGWTADTQVFAETGLYFAKVDGFLRKWLADLRDGQTDTGEFRGVAPTGLTDGGKGRIGWSDAGVIVPYRIWRMTGDTSVIREHYPAMSRFVDRIAQTKHETCQGYEYADWLSFEKLETCRDKIFAQSPLKPVAERWWRYLGACYWLADARMMKEMCAAIGNDDESCRYAAMADSALRYVRDAFLESDGQLFELVRDMQTANVFALKLGIYRTPEDAAVARRNLLQNIADHGNCLQTGFLGTSLLMETLTETGSPDMAYTLLLQDKCPSWLYSVGQGATTIWERWNSYTRETGFGPVSMNSFNHYAYGSVVGWIFSTAAGIRPDSEKGGWRQFRLEPRPDRRLGSCHAEFDGGYGKIISDWCYDSDGTFRWSYTVPEGTVAEVRMPDGETVLRRAGTYEYVSGKDVPVWPAPTNVAKPWVYNWWMASAVDEKGLESQCAELAKSGFGGFHVIPIYGAKGYEGEYRSFLSPEWIEAWNGAVRIARKYGLGVDLTMGSGWCFGGPWVTPEDAASSGMRVKRAGPGGEGYMIDPFSPVAMSNHLARFEAAFGKNGTAERPRAFYHDSYEYYQARPKHGEEIDAAQIACFKVWTDWCRSNGYLTRNEAHGSPANWLDLYALADIPETEMFADECRDILISKFASSAAHVTGKKLVSSESCTWIKEHFTATLADYKAFVDRLFLSGVNHLFYHGCCYSPTDATWPGWCFYAAGQMNPRNPIWRDVGTLNAYVARCQAMFQACEPDNDTLVYWPVDDYRASVDVFRNPMTVHNAPGWFHAQPLGAVARRLTAEGRAFDYVSDRQLQTLDLSRYADLVVPPCTNVSAATRAAIARFVRRPVRCEPFPKSGLPFVRFRRGDEAVYFLANTNAACVTCTALPSTGMGAAWLMDPMDGSIREIGMDASGVRLSLDPFASVFLVIGARQVAANVQGKVATAPSPSQRSIPVSGEWTLEPVCGGPVLPPVRMTDGPCDWSADPDEKFASFAGTMRYRVRFALSAEELASLRQTNGVSLDLGRVEQSARVKLNGVDLGCRILSPFRFAVPNAVLAEQNELAVEVTSIGANRIRWNDRTGVEWKCFNDINFISIRGVLEHTPAVPFDASSWPVRPSGLLGPVTLLYQGSKVPGTMVKAKW